MPLGEWWVGRCLYRNPNYTPRAKVSEGVCHNPNYIPARKVGGGMCTQPSELTRQICHGLTRALTRGKMGENGKMEKWGRMGKNGENRGETGGNVGIRGEHTFFTGPCLSGLPCSPHAGSEYTFFPGALSGRAPLLAAF